MGVAGDHSAVQLNVGVRVPVKGRVSLSALMAGRYHQGWQARDTLLAAPIRVVDKPAAVWTVGPGLALPTGTLGVGGDFTPLSTGSVDPWLTTSFVAGTGWLFTALGQVRPVLYEGRDDVHQGSYWRGDLGMARRFGDHVVRVGVSSAGVVDDFSEVSISAGGVINLSDQFALVPWVRVPLTEEAYAVAGGASISWVRRPTEGHDEDEEVHPHGGSQ